MLAEKLLLNVLIILMPVFIQSLFFENKNIRKSPYLCGVFQSISVFLSLVFSYEEGGLFWDLRYVPLVLAFLYGGPIAGGMVLVSYLATRSFMGGDLLLGYASGFLATIVPSLFMKKFWKFDAKKRIRTAVFVGFWPTFVMLVILVANIIINEATAEDTNRIMMNVAIFGAIQVFAVWVAVILNESLIEKEMMRKEILRAEKLNTLGELAASIAHEIRNPLTVVKGFLQMMHKQEKGDNYYYLSLVLTELGRAESIINDYLNFAKPQFEKLEDAELAKLLTEVTLLLEAFAAKEGVQVNVQLEWGVYVKTDRNQLKQALVNIIKNGIEATDEGGEVVISQASAGDYSYIVVSDTGKGMDSEQLARLGTLFYTTKDKGTGLGTSVSIKIIEAMGGTISYKSEPGVGTEVTVILPSKKKTPTEEEPRIDLPEIIVKEA
ncbi:ATP-binding protein [Mesobacillus subterraneus]|uniref:histidine kinase n=1 Tax=Mesobacillus subterraneus TaxID=285983 RepID=A0A3R9FEJ9_9BACI|nr:ATP-binding protein [Mesobacillus subterraneus]RSD24030.1 two-component sensor histidine kinase [Mesobacillus subterraneus]